MRLLSSRAASRCSRGSASSRCSDSSRRNAEQSGRPEVVDQIREAEVHPAGALPAGSGDQAECDTVEQHPGGNAGAAEQALRPALGSCLQSAGTGAHLVEVLPGVEHLHQQLPRRRAVLRVAFAHREVRTECLTVVRENDRARSSGMEAFFRVRVALGREAPAEDLTREFSKVSHARLRIAPRGDRPLVDAAGEQRLALCILTVQDRSCFDQRRRRDHQTVGLDETQPFEMGACVRILRRHSRQPRPIRWSTSVSRSLDRTSTVGLPASSTVHDRYCNSALTARHSLSNEAER